MAPPLAALYDVAVLPKVRVVPVNPNTPAALRDRISLDALTLNAPVLHAYAPMGRIDGHRDLLPIRESRATVLGACAGGRGIASRGVPVQHLAGGAADYQRAVADDRRQQLAGHAVRCGRRFRPDAQCSVDKRLLDRSP
jgi:hypothetical protein